MRFNVISNLTNGVGLQRDYELLREELEKRGHQVHGVQFNRPVVRHADVNVFLEVVAPQVFPWADRQWAVPNPEWWFAGWYKFTWDKILAKTWDCHRIFVKQVGDRCQYLGWLARDLYDPAIPREPVILHVAGKSRFKNTLAVIEGCRRAKVPLTVVSEWIGIRRHIADAQLKHQMNRHLYHVMPSAYEGYGQVLHEALGVGQVIVTTDAPPMNEIVPAILVPSHKVTQHHSGTLHAVSAEAVEVGVRQALQLSATDVEEWQTQARCRFQQERVAFGENLDQLLGSL